MRPEWTKISDFPNVKGKLTNPDFELAWRLLPDNWSLFRNRDWKISRTVMLREGTIKEAARAVLVFGKAINHSAKAAGSYRWGDWGEYESDFIGKAELTNLVKQLYGQIHCYREG